MKNNGVPVSKYLRISAALFVSLQLLCTPVQAQFDPTSGGFDDEPIDEVIGYGQRTFSSYFTTTVYSIPEGMGREFFLAQLNSILDWDPATIGDNVTDEDIQARCDQNASDFRRTCLSAANTANLTCATTGVGVTAYGAFMGLLPGAISATVFTLGCGYVNNVAVNSCNNAADNSTYPGASALCS